VVQLHSRKRIRIHTHQVPGAARPIILLHGLLSSGRQWRGTLERLAGGGDLLLAPDLPGFGFSGLVRMPQRLEDYADALEAWAVSLGLPPAVLVGHSFGGMVATDWAARYPQRAAALGLLAPAIVPHGFGVPRPFGHPTLGRALLGLVSLPPVGRRFFRFVVDDVNSISREDAASWTWSVRRCRALLGLRDFYTLGDLGAVLGELRCPVRMGWGMRDQVLPVADADVIHAALPRMELVRWPCGHSVMAERPADSDRFIREVADLAWP